MKKNQIYISGALTGLEQKTLDEMKDFYEKMMDVCEQCGFYGYVPHLRTDPKKHHHFTPEQIDDMDRSAVKNSSALVACLDIASFGVGIEIEMANTFRIPVIAIYSQKNFDDAKISQLARGNPAICFRIHYAGYEEALGYLKDYLISEQFKNELSSVSAMRE